MGIINKLYDVHAVPSKNVQFPIDEEAQKNSPSQCNFGLHRKPPPRPLPLPTSIGTFSKFGVLRLLHATVRFSTKLFHVFWMLLTMLLSALPNVCPQDFFPCQSYLGSVSFVVLYMHAYGYMFSNPKSLVVVSTPIIFNALVLHKANPLHPSWVRFYCLRVAMHTSWI